MKHLLALLRTRSDRTPQVLAAAFVCTLALAACQRAAEHANDLDPAGLLALRFVGDAAEKPIDLRPIGLDLAQPEDITPLEVVKFDDTHALLLTEVQTEEDCHACGGVMGAYFYERDAKGWRLVRYLDAAIAAGANGKLGKVSVAALQGTLHAATIEWGSCWQGTCGSWLVVVALQPDAVRELDSVPLAINNDGRFGACELLDKAAGLARPDAPKADSLTPEQRACQDIESEWKFEGPRLLVNFKGRMLEFKGNALLPLRKIDQRTVYAVSGTEVKLAEGENPVPAF
jgi:hypothetical protein